MSPRRILCACLLWFGLITIPSLPARSEAFFAEGSTPRFSLITRLDGLPNNSVSSIIQDRRGFLWLGTQGGLAMYDGRGFQTFRNIPFNASSLPQDLVQTLYYDEEADELWIGTYRGLAMHRIGEPGFTTYAQNPEDPTSLSNDVVIAIERDAEGRLWVGTLDGLNRMEADGSFTRIPAASPTIRDIHLDSRGTLWVGSLAGLERWNPLTGRLEPIEVELPSAAVMAIREREPGELILGCWDAGVVTVDLDAMRAHTRVFADNTIYSLLVGSDGTLWVGTWGGGLFVVSADGTEYSFPGDDDTILANPVVYSLFEDDTEGVWIGTNGGGLHRLTARRRSFRVHFNDPERPASLPAGKINAMTRDPAGRLWVGLYTGGVAFYEGPETGWRQYRPDPDDPGSVAHEIVRVLYTDRSGRLWVGSHGGLQVYNEADDRFLTFGIDIYPGVDLGGMLVYDVLEDSRGRFWIGTYVNGVLRFDPASGELVRYRHDPADRGFLSNNLVYDIYEDRDGRIWIGTNGGLNLYEPQDDRFRRYLYEPSRLHGLSSNTVRTILQDSGGSLWVGTVSGGLNLLNEERGTFDHVTIENGMSSNSVLSIHEDPRGRLWMATQQGISVYDPGAGTVQVFDERDGLYGSEFHDGSFQEADGSLLFGGSHGISRLDAGFVRGTTRPPRVQIVDVAVYQESIAPFQVSFNDERIELAHTDAFVSFEFVGLDYDAPQSNSYAYMLEGFDREWIRSGTRNYASYTNLPAGTYRFLVNAANSDGRWSAAPASMTVVVHAPWYGRWWAFALYGLAALALTYGIVRVRDSFVLHKKNLALQLANDRLADANEQLARLSVRDALTGIFNRRYFDIHLDEEWSRARRANAALTVLMIDVDHFKAYNDTHGHLAGDRCLAQVATLLASEMVRTTDVVARYGGEEFAVLMFGTYGGGAMKVAERIRGAVERGAAGSTLPPVTISVGVASAVPVDDDLPSALMERADAALYRAKRNGRNRVEAAPDEGALLSPSAESLD